MAGAILICTSNSIWAIYADQALFIETFLKKGIISVKGNLFLLPDIEFL